MIELDDPALYPEPYVASERVLAYLRSVINADSPVFVPKELVNEVETVLVMLGSHKGISKRIIEGRQYMCLVGGELLRALINAGT